MQSKILVFVSSGKQVRETIGGRAILKVSFIQLVSFIFETFCKLQPGIPLLRLHGKQKQATRLATCTRFTSTKHTVLLSTDLAARGLGFPVYYSPMHQKMQRHTYIVSTALFGTRATESTSLTLSKRRGWRVLVLNSLVFWPTVPY